MSEYSGPHRNMALESLLKEWDLPFEIVNVELGKIEVLGSQQVRDADHIADKQQVARYVVQMEAGATFPALVVRKHGEGAGIMLDGNTRRAAALSLGRTHFPAYVVEIPNGSTARDLGTVLNQMNGKSLTEAEARRAAEEMITNGHSETAIARATGLTVTKIRQWRAESNAIEHAERADVSDEVEALSAVQQRAVSKVVQDKPFAELVKMASNRKVPNAVLSELVRDVNKASSEDEALELIDRAAIELRPTGFGQTVIVNTKAKHMRMVLPQVLNIEPADVLEITRAESDLALWVKVQAKAADVIEFYRVALNNG